MIRPTNLTLLALLSTLIVASAAYAADDHDSHDHGKHEAHADSDHDDHKDEDDHDTDHQESDAHGHADENDEHGDHDEDKHGEDETSISPAAAQAAGIEVKTAKAGNVQEMLNLTGRVILNPNETANVRGRFPGIVKSVHVNLGQKVKRGQLLARVESNDSLRVYDITAPQAGIVLERHTNKGDVAGDASLFKIADLSTVWAEFHVFPKDVQFVSQGLPIWVSTLGNGRQEKAKIDLVFPTADQFSQTIQTIVTLKNPAGYWRPGMTITGAVGIHQKDVAVAIEHSALQVLENRKVVFVREGEKFMARPVEVGLQGGQMIEILSGLQAGEDYVAQGSFIIKADIGKEAAEHSH